jgi:hypothetical protein
MYAVMYIVVLHCACRVSSNTTNSVDAMQRNMLQALLQATSGAGASCPTASLLRQCGHPAVAMATAHRLHEGGANRRSTTSTFRSDRAPSSLAPCPQWPQPLHPTPHLSARCMHTTPASGAITERPAEWTPTYPAYTPSKATVGIADFRQIYSEVLLDPTLPSLPPSSFLPPSDPSQRACPNSRRTCIAPPPDPELNGAPSACVTHTLTLLSRMPQLPTPRTTCRRRIQDK